MNNPHGLFGCVAMILYWWIMLVILYFTWDEVGPVTWTFLFLMFVIVEVRNILKSKPCGWEPDEHGRDYEP